MMSHSLCHFLLLVFLTGRDVLLVKASNNTIRCGYDNCCQAMAKLMTGFNEINNKQDEPAACPGLNEKIDKQAKDLEELKEKLAAISTQLHEIHGKQAKDQEELKVKLDRSLASTDAISTQLQKHSADLLSHDERLKAHDASQTDLYQNLKGIQSPKLKPRDCSDIRELGSSVSGVYRVYPGSENRSIEVDVYCDFTSVGQSWLVLQRRKDGSVDFNRIWTDYANGFGGLTGEFWIGNDKLSLITMNKKYKLRIELEDFLGEKRWAEYSTFSVNPASDKYRLTAAGYSGNAEDSFTNINNNDNNMMFSTKDADNDRNNAMHCAQSYSGGFWFHSCGYCNLNGLYLRGPQNQNQVGIFWYHWKGTAYYSLKATEMKITAVM